MRALVLIAAVFLAVGLNSGRAHSQIAASPQKPVSRIVTILSDTLGQPNSTAAQILGEAAVAIDRDGDMRVLTVAGYGGVQNVNDLLLLRGADLAVLNSDIFVHLDITKAYPDAVRRIKLVTSLFSQAVFLFARRGIDNVDALTERKICVPASTDQPVSLKTILHLLKIKAAVTEIEAGKLRSSGASGCDAVFLYEQSIDLLQGSKIGPDDFQLISIPADDAVKKVYREHKLKKENLGAFASSDLTTLQVTSVLATYNWAPKKTRYLDVVAFIEKLFKRVAADRARKADTMLATVDIALEPPGWQRFPPAATLAVSLGLPAISSAGPGDKPLFSEAGEPSAIKSITLGAVVRPPLVNGPQEKGGVLLDLFSRSMAAAGIEASITWAQSERELFDNVLAAKSVDVGLFWQTPNCEMHNGQAALEAFLCDRAEFSDPLMHMVLGIFSRIDASLSDNRGPDAQTRTVCVPESLSVPREMLSTIPWLEGQTVRYLRPKILIECLAALSRREADAMIAIEPEARFAIERLKLAGELHLSQKISSPLALHAFISKEHPNQASLLADLNLALSKFRESQGYAAVLSAYMTELAGAQILKASPE